MNETSSSLNFALILFLLLVVCFAAWLADRLHFRGRRERQAQRLVERGEGLGGVVWLCVGSSGLQAPNVLHTRCKASDQPNVASKQLDS